MDFSPINGFPNDEQDDKTKGESVGENYSGIDEYFIESMTLNNLLLFAFLATNTFAPKADFYSV